MLIEPARRPAARAEIPTPLPKMDVEDVGLSSNFEEPVEQFPLNADVLPPMYNKSDAGADVVEKFRKVSGTVWVSLKAVVIENTLKEE